MLSKVPKELLLIFLIAVACIVVLAIIAGIVIIIRTIIKSKKSGNYIKLKHNLIAVSCVIIAVTSWLFNFGWLRFIMTLVALPFIHAVIFFFVGNFAATYIDKSRKLKIFTVLSYITYLVGYLLLPDGGDTGGMYAFFGLIHNETIVNICYLICAFAVQLHIIFIILQIVFASAEKNKLKNEEVKQ